MRTWDSVRSDQRFAEMEDLLWSLGRRMWEMERGDGSALSDMRKEIEAALGCDFRSQPRSWGIPERASEVTLRLEDGADAVGVASAAEWIKGVERAEVS